MKYLKHIFICLLCIPYSLLGQDVERLLDAPILSSGGGVSVNQIVSESSSEQNYSLYLSGNLNTTILGVVSMPVSFAYTNDEVSTSLPQPFNRFSMSPSYKWVTTHLGYSSMNFSSYTLSGHEFLGAGVELSPEKFPLKISALYGRFQKAVENDTLQTSPAYKRMGGGLKLEYTHKMVDVSVDFFKAKDDVNSITQEMQLPNDTSTIDQIKPQDNATGSLMLNLRLTDKLSFKAEYGLSAMNYDISKEDSTASSFSNSIVQQSGDLALYYAFKTSLTQSTSIGTWGATYERVDPNYKTLGAYYFNNDLENLTANLSTTIFKTLNIGVDLGYQRDNLESQKMNGSFTTLYNVNASAQLTPKLNLGASFSNNQTHVYIKSIYDELEQTNEFQNLDTLNFTQINLNTGATVSYILKSSEMQKQHLNFAFSYQQAAESQEQDQRFMGTEIYNTTGSYLFSLIEQKLNISTTVNNNYTKMEETNLSVMSYNVSIQKTLAEKVRLSLISTYSSSLSGGEKMADIVNVRFSSSYTLAQKHNFNLSVASVSNITASGNRKQLSGTLAYSYLFDFRLLKKDKKMKFEGNF